MTGQLTVCATAGVASYLFMQIAGVPYAALLAIVVALLDLVPQVGATLAAVACALSALTESFGLALATVAFFLIYQQFENVILAPRIFSKAVSLSITTVFVSVLLGSAVAGLLGAILALPVAAALKVVVQFIARSRGWRWVPGDVGRPVSGGPPAGAGPPPGPAPTGFTSPG